MQPVYYFAYGSNLLESRLRDRLYKYVKDDEVIKYKKYLLYGYKLVFNCGDTSFGRSKNVFANIIKSHPNDFVEGILYTFDGERMDTLDLYEGLYKKQFFLDGNDICFTYISSDPFFKVNGKPTLQYLNVILDGAFEQQLWHVYNMLVDYKNTMYKLKSNTHKKVII